MVGLCESEDYIYGNLFFSWSFRLFDMLEIIFFELDFCIQVTEIKHDMQSNGFRFPIHQNKD